MTSGKCIVCSKNSFPKQSHTVKYLGDSLTSDFEGPNTANDFIEDQLEVIFLLRKILEIPGEICCNFLQNFGDPNLWCSVCTSCVDLVEKARNIFGEMMILEKQYEALQIKIKNTILSSVNFEGPDLEAEKKCGVNEIVRSYISKESVNYSTFAPDSLKINEGQHFSDSENEDSISLPSSPPSPDFIPDWCIEKQSPVKTEGSDLTENNLRKGNCLEENESNETANPDSHSRILFSPDRNFLDIQQIKTRKSDDNRSKNLNRKKINTRSKRKTGKLIYQDEKSGDSPKHQRTHSRERPYKCDTCGKGFKQISGLKDHLKTHTGEKSHVCSICGRACSLASNLRKHIIRMHKNVKSKIDGTEECPTKSELKRKSKKEKIILSCEVCQKSFSNNSKLKTHVLTHTGVRPYQCDICDKSYTKISHLKDHQMSHTGERPFVCDYCGSGFINLGNLNKHLRTHTGEKPFKCKTCGKSFCQVGNFKAHLKVHTGEKPYTCDICGKSFLTRNYLKSHTNTHTGEKPHTCEFCGKGFTHRGYVRKHKIRAHQNNVD